MRGKRCDSEFGLGGIGADGGSVFACAPMAHGIVKGGGEPLKGTCQESTAGWHGPDSPEDISMIRNFMDIPYMQ